MTPFCSQWHLDPAQGKEYTVEQWILWQLALRSAKAVLEAKAPVITIGTGVVPALTQPLTHSSPPRGMAQEGENIGWSRARKLTWNSTSSLYNPVLVPCCCYSSNSVLSVRQLWDEWQSEMVVLGLPRGHICSFLPFLPLAFHLPQVRCPQATESTYSTMEHLLLLPEVPPAWLRGLSVPCNGSLGASLNGLELAVSGMGQPWPLLTDANILLLRI